MKFKPLALCGFVCSCMCVRDHISEHARQAREHAINHSFCCFAASGRVINSKFLNVANERTSNQKNKQMNKQMPNEQPNAEQTNRKSEGKSVFESFKLWDFTLLKMIIQTKICYLF